MWTNIIIVSIALISGILMLWRLPLVDDLAESAGHAGGDASGLRLPARPGDLADTARSSAASVSIIIPARNEERRLPPLLASLRQQEIQPLELIVVDDHSTDRTADIARQGGARVILADAPADGWTGKSRACWSGSRQAAGDWILFLDADTRLDRPDSLARLLAAFAALGGRGALSLQPHAVTEKPYEALSAVFNIIVMAGMGTFTPWGGRLRNAGMFGPCIICSRADYFAAGGHEGVRAHVLDDLALGTAFLRAGLPVRNASGRGVISFRMYAEGFHQLWEGWSKNFSQGAAATNLPVLLLIILWVSGAFSAVTLLVMAVAPGGATPLLAALAGWILYTLMFIWLARRAGRFPPALLVLFPIPFTFFAIVFAWSTIQTKILHRVTWRGRNIEV